MAQHNATTPFKNLTCFRVKSYGISRFWDWRESQDLEGYLFAIGFSYFLGGDQAIQDLFTIEPLFQQLLGKG